MPVAAQPDRNDLRANRPIGSIQEATTNTYPIRDAARRLHDEIRRALALGELLRHFDALDPVAEVPAPDMLLELAELTRPLARRTWEASELLLCHVIGRDGAPSRDDVVALTAALSRATSDARAELGVDAPQCESDGLEAVDGAAFELYREVGLAELGLDLFLGRRDGAEVIAAKPVHPHTAHIWQLGRLLERIGSLVLGHDLLELERRGSHWWFSTHSPPPSAGTAFAAAVREQEWSLVERDSLLLGAPLLDVFLRSERCASTPASQRTLSAALQSSFTSCFLVRSRDTESALLEDVATGRVIEVHEHNGEVEYHKGWIALGRVAAFDRALHLRSPGMVFHPPDEELAAVVRQSLRSGPFDLPAPIRVECIVSMIRGQRGLPRSLPAASSPAEAQGLLRALTDALEEAGLSHEVPPEDSDPELVRQAKRSGLSGVSYRRYDLDASMAAWMQALGVQARKPRGKGARRRRAT